MLYPFTFTVDLRIQADNYEEALGAAQDYLEMDFLKEFMSVPQINMDELEIVDYAVENVSDYDENSEPWDEHGRVIRRK